MPKYTHRSTGPAGWLLLCLVGAGVLYAAVANTKPFLFAAAVFAVLYALASLQGAREARRLQALARIRKDQTICAFARDFDARAVDTWIIRAVYEQLQGQLQHLHPAFPVRADDRLNEDLCLDDDDLDMELAREIEARTGRPLNGSADNPYFGRVQTVRDLVLFFQSQPRSGPAA